MNFVYVLIICAFIFIQNHVAVVCTFDNLQTKTNPEIQANAVVDLIKRIIPKDAHKFSVTISQLIGPSQKDTFQLEKLQNGTVKITGTTGVAAATGFHHYLKYYCKCHISWEANNLNVPNVLPNVNITITSNDKFRYYQNVCTTSYSFVWWDWNQWEKHIDWMVLNSFNLVLSFNGQEAIWKRIYERLNLTAGEIEEHFTGPAFLSWGRMGNIRGWGGVLSDSWHKRSLMLQHRILKRMREFGVIPVLPAFAGHVPRGFKRLFPNATMTKTGTWNNFNDTYCCPYLLDPTDPLFERIGSMFIRELTAEFDTDHVYNCDTFNEMTPASGDLNYLSNMGHSIFGAMTSADPNAVWVLQNWLFVHDSFWTIPRAEALLTSVPRGKMLVLDLQSEQHPQYNRLNSYYGQPFIWCMLHNFGGTLGMFGSAETINNEIFAARNKINGTMVGTGITPEGINQNYVMYDFVNEMGWRKEPVDLSKWFSDYAERRYGKKEPNTIQAWQILKHTLYNYTSLLPMRGKYAVNRRPSSQITTWIWYDSHELFEAWDIFLQSADTLNGSLTYLHDLVDITRQVLQVLGDNHYENIISAFKNKKTLDFQNASNMFMEVLGDMELILQTNKAFLLGPWISSAKAAASNSEDEQLFEYNARNQITLWGPNGEITDYASKQWSGIVSDYFIPRWQTFLDSMNKSLMRGTPFNERHLIQEIFTKDEEPFTFDRKIYPVVPSGNTIEVAKNIHAKWWARIHCRRTRSDKSNETDLLGKHEIEKTNPHVYLI